ncbi:hypothetical protein BFV94_4398 [Alteromonas macleodii]|uniref:Uncharacterized protein n=2 Tax=Alteromonas macleodii TaxID=28108 RepID=A0AB36FMT2_ALTMA|nr:hypothetical protein BFV95_4755 [Alteromonas macleodii]OES25545.1 hypothetical protein BFV94_4398 [Alteromonas macleodii]OES25846.1 hypothetical protein BFV93_4309 [Alteromonas macleodii]OES38632.1 hypothetical protein BFV96_4743 [Alteromonas macleodii]
MDEWQINFGMKPAAKLVDVRFAGHDGQIEECLREHPDEWVWTLDQEGGTITMFRIVEGLPSDISVRKRATVPNLIN